jgi:PLP dependent protein
VPDDLPTIRDKCEGKCGDDPVHPAWQLILHCITLHQFNIVPAVSNNAHSSLVQHCICQVDTNYSALGPNGLLQKWEIEARTAANVNHQIANSEVQRSDSLSSPLFQRRDTAGVILFRPFTVDVNHEVLGFRATCSPHHALRSPWSRALRLEYKQDRCNKQLQQLLARFQPMVKMGSARISRPNCRTVVFLNRDVNYQLANSLYRQSAQCTIMMLMLSLLERYHTIQERIMEAAARAGRSPAEVTLVAVTKMWPAPKLLEAYEIGIRHFGENRAEELAGKRAEVEAVLGPNNGIVWHLIGPLQSRKSDLAADHADIFHALDRLKIAKRLAQRLEENGRLLPVFLEVNVSGEAGKAGFACRRWENDTRQREEIRQAATVIAGLPGLQLQGLMTMAPWNVAPGLIRATFQRTRALAEWLQTAVPQANWSALSMGMTDDFEIAIEEKATHVRIGRAIFGERE